MNNIRDISYAPFPKSLFFYYYLLYSTCTYVHAIRYIYIHVPCIVHTYKHTKKKKKSQK